MVSAQETRPSARGVGLEKQLTLNSDNSKQMSSSNVHTATQAKVLLLPPPFSAAT